MVLFGTFRGSNHETTLRIPYKKTRPHKESSKAHHLYFPFRSGLVFMAPSSTISRDHSQDRLSFAVLAY